MSLIIPANSVVDSGYNVENSLRFNSASNDYLNRTPSSSGNRKTFTVSFWVKLAETSFRYITGADAGSGQEYIQMGTTSSATVRVFNNTSGATINVSTNQVFRDPSAWYHIVFAIDSTQGTASNRVKIYVNGTEATYSSTTYPDQNLDLNYNQASVSQGIGARGDDTGGQLNGYLSEYVFIDGQQLTPTSFGEFDEDNGIWKPIDGLADDLTFGTNGFYLEFKESGTGTNASGMGADTSGNDNHFAVNNLTAIDQSTDTCTNNFATLNPLAPMDTGSSVQALSEGNLKANGPAEGVGWQTAYATIPLSLGKWYIEVLVTQVSGNEVVIGLNPDNFSNTSDTAHSNSGSGVWYQSNGLKWISGSSSSYGATYDDGDIISVLINMDDSEVTFYKNDASQGTISFNTNLTAASSIIFGLNGIETTSITQTNFGSPPYAITSGNQDANGFGNFEFATKGGYALNTKNLAEYG